MDTGGRAPVLAALERLICALEKCGGWDQFVWSKLVWTGGLGGPVAVATTDEGPVANLCSNLAVRVGDGNAVLDAAQGAAYAVVHQYDRYDVVASAVAARYPYVGGG